MTTAVPAHVGKVQVVLLEVGQVEWVRKKIEECLRRIGYEAEVVPVVVNGAQASTRGTNDLLADQVVDVFVSDISLGSRGEEDGLDHLRSVKSLFPDVLAVGISGKNVDHNRVVAKYPSYDVFMDKRLITQPRYAEYLSSELRRRFRKNVCAFVDWESSRLGWKVTQRERVGIERLLRGITFTSHEAERESQVHRIVLEEIKRGYSKSRVLRMRTFTSNGLSCVNSVLRLSEPARSDYERRNFVSFVKWYLPYSFRVELIGDDRNASLAGIAYAFAYDGKDDFSTLSAWFRQGAERKEGIAAILNRLFGANNQRWYAHENLKTEADIAEHYDTRLYPTAEAKARVREAFATLVRGHGLGNRNCVEIDEYEYPIPDVFLGERHNELATSICHGDLHGDNLLVTDAGGFCFIDFQRTGRGHVFCDFAALEMSVRLEWPAEKAELPTSGDGGKLNLGPLVDAELAIARGESSDTVSYGDIVTEIRRLARLNFPDEPWENYLVAAASYGYWITGFSNDREAPMRARGAAAALACIRRIRELEVERERGSGKAS